MKTRAKTYLAFIVMSVLAFTVDAAAATKAVFSGDVTCHLEKSNQELRVRRFFIEAEQIAQCSLDGTSPFNNHL